MYQITLKIAQLHKLTEKTMLGKMIKNMSGKFTKTVLFMVIKIVWNNNLGWSTTKQVILKNCVHYLKH